VVPPSREKAPLWPDLRPVTQIGDKLLASTPAYGFGRIAEKLLAIEQLDTLYAVSLRQQGLSFFESFLHELKIRCDYQEQDLARIPETGPVVVVSNHPFGFAEAPVLASLLSRRRHDIRFLANTLLSGIEVLRDHLIPVDVFGGRNSTRSNFRGMRAAIEWLRQNGLLVVFPAGEVASLRLPQFRVTDPAWNETIGRIARIAQATVIPAFFHGGNSRTFHIAGLIHPLLRTALLPRELFEKTGRTISVSFGAPILPRVAALLSDRNLTAYLRMRTELLQTRTLPRLAAHSHQPRLHPIAAPGEKSKILAEVAALTPLLSSGPLGVFVAESGQLTHVLPEIGRLRELSFRAAGEGTGRARDVDRFDAWYRHLFVWNSEREEIVGAYRVGMADSIIAEHGPRGLYTTTLFKFQADFFLKLGPALELGRSFVREEYQRDYLPLLLLWKGISQFVARHPRYRTLFGPVSISNDYRAISRALIIEYCKAHGDPQLSRGVRPRRRFHSAPLPGCDHLPVASLAEDIAGLSTLIADLEPDNKGVPVLLRQYLNLGGTVLEFNLDPRFSNAVDGLILVDLLKADRRLLERYMGRDGLASFYRFHGR